MLTEIASIKKDSYKDASPLDTVNKIKSILEKYNIETEEQWFESGVPYCYSVKVDVKGTSFFSSGKGLTRDFALASGYGELIERLQIGYLGNLESQKSGDYSEDYFVNVSVPANELLKENIDWYNLYHERLNFFTGEKIDPENILMQYADTDGNIPAIPFYCINKKKIQYLPSKLVKNVYTSNGCAAGNSPEEAIVQALSEIVERHHLTKLMFDDITPPDVPDEVLKKYKVAYSIILCLRDNGYKVIVKDCSFGKKFPVVSVCIIDRETGKYHTRFGASPIFEVALDRAFTESFQGINIRSIAKFIDFRFKGEGHFDMKNLLTELRFGRTEKLPGFFVGKPQYEYNENMGFKGETNKALLKECIDYFSDMGFDILIKDSSCLGFCTYQVIVPGYSECFSHRLSPNFNDLHYRNSSVRTLRNPSKVTFDEKLGFLMSLSRSNSGFVVESRLHLNLTSKESAYYMAATLAYVYYDLKKYDMVFKNINLMLESKIAENEEFLICLKRYVSLLINKYSNENIESLLYLFHKEESVNKLLSFVENNKNPFDEFTLHCDKKCKVSCPLYDKCCNKKVVELSELIFEKTKEMDFNNLIQTINDLLE